MSSAEVKLGCELRSRSGALKVRRQHPAGPYVIHFYCANARLASEVDGAFHDRRDRPALDAGRNAFLARYGFETLRVPAWAVYADLDAVLN